MIDELKKRLNFEVNSIQFVNRDGYKFLDIELPESKLNVIEEKTKIISKILDEIDDGTIDNYYLNVFSSGTEKEIDLKNIDLFINNNLLIKTTKPYLEKQEWEGILVSNDLSNITLKINNKGRMQKLKINKTDINFIKTTAKFKKEKYYE
ncbi:MAG: hypothetical protein HDR43_02685 [Mycoplasma sp.]|nr:hypothetical protein [Mycoplasma sp.]